MKSPYKFKKSIEDKLFHGIVIPTAKKEGYDMSNHAEVVNMMAAMAKKYHSMTKNERKAIIKIAESNIEKQLNKLNGEENEKTE